MEQYLSAILSLEPSQSYAGMLGLLVQFCTSHKEMDVANQHKGQAGAGRERASLGWPQPLASSEVGWFSIPTLAFAVMCEERERFLWFWLGWALLQLLGC